MEEYRRLPEQLEAVLAGTVDIYSVLDDPSWFTGSGQFCYQGLWHFALDEPMRREDPEYAAMQAAEMTKLIRLLRSGAGREQLESVNFRGRSR